MKITEILKNATETKVSFEILPPLKGKSIQSLFNILDPLMEFNPPFIDVTYHREDFIYKLMPSGYYEKVAIRKRPGTVGICAAIMNKYNVEAVPHLICGGFTVEETEDALIELNYLGVQNVLALRGDARKFEKNFVAEIGGHKYASDMVKQMSDMNEGNYLDKEISNAVKTDFCIGVAGYPEKHFEATSYRKDLTYLKQKIDGGGDYIVTQMFFDNKKFLDFVNDCREMGITVPIIPGLKPLTRKSQLSSIPSTFYIDIPEALESEMEKCKTPEAEKQLGIEWCISQSKELLKAGIPCLHYYTMSDVKMVSEIVKNVL
ncbi:MAG: methylenetetrahydrofolate reductase [NAD(P)H] [Bacteroidetes bacterium]|nr:methylenetetrahydrofolate reductase [NAD(P)H] [Bacteroidota bacterium]MBK9354058.1 methylenetetrahydrofolate reductase [NAD(P)H] [Bacteroidota bacterium]MBL0079923.1 methylenetetrahydrofolate reductase [NAD(P)H] [Bacteroidota bacterium]